MFRQAWPTALLALVWTAAPAICGILLLANLGILSDWLQIDPTIGLAAYVIIFIITAGLGFLPTYAQALLGGWVFGMWIGTPAALAGFTGAAVLGYAIAHYVSRDQVRNLISEDVRAQAIRDSLVGRGFWPTLGIVSLLRLPPNSPFALTNLVMASTGVKMMPYVLGTAIGMAPRTAVATVVAAMGAATGSRDLQELAQERGLMVVGAGLVVMVIVLAIIGTIANRALERVNSNLVRRRGASANDAEDDETSQGGMNAGDPGTFEGPDPADAPGQSEGPSSGSEPAAISRPRDP